MKTNILTIKTPEGITFSFLLAGPVTRFLAWIIDQMCISVISGIVLIPTRFLGVLSPDLVPAAYVLLSFVISIGYGIALEWYWHGQTVGKRLLRLRVMDERGLRLQFSQVAVRNFLRFVDMLPYHYLVGGIACLASRKAQRLGDFAANTIVVRNPKIAEPDLDQLLAGKYNSFRDYPHLAARLRQCVSPQEAGITLHALVRRDQLDPTSRVELFSEIASHFQSIVDFPQEATDGISDEQYIRNVADIVWTKK